MSCLRNEQHGIATNWPPGILSRAKTIEVLKRHNEWRRGGEGPQTDPRMLGLALDAVIAYIEQHGIAPPDCHRDGGEAVTLNARIDQFLADVHDPANITTTRTHLTTAVGLLREAGNHFRGVTEMVKPAFKHGDRVRLKPGTQPARRWHGIAEWTVLRRAVTPLGVDPEIIWFTASSQSADGKSLYADCFMQDHLEPVSDVNRKPTAKITASRQRNEPTKRR